MTTTQALEVLKKHTTKPNLIKHAIAVSAAMRHFAKLENEEAEFWATVGILHDIDFELYPEKHCHKSVELLKKEGLCEKTIRAIQSHGFEICSDVEPVHYMEKVLCAVDQLTGFIIACALVRPEKKLEFVDMDSIKKKWGKKDFAAGTNRARIERMCERMGKSFEHVAQETLTALQAAASELGL